MVKQEEQIDLWNECKEMFRKTKNNETDELLKSVITIIKKHKNILSEVADIDFLNYITNIKATDYIIGTNGDNYELILDNYLKLDDCNLENIWRILSQLVWDLSALVSDNVCPSCKADHIAYYTDKSNTLLYESCLGCFSTWESSKLIRRPKEIFPAPKIVLTKYQII